MSNQDPFDFGGSFREMVTQWERSYDAFANQFMGTETFSRSMNQAQDAQLAAQKAFQEFVSKNLEAMHLPSRDDLLRIGEAVRRVDAKLDRLEAMMLAQGAPADTDPLHNERPSGPPRTKLPPSKMGGQS